MKYIVNYGTQGSIKLSIIEIENFELKSLINHQSNLDFTIECMFLDFVNETLFKNYLGTNEPLEGLNPGAIVLQSKQDMSYILDIDNSRILKVLRLISKLDFKNVETKILHFIREKGTSFIAESKNRFEIAEEVKKVFESEPVTFFKILILGFNFRIFKGLVKGIEVKEYLDLEKLKQIMILYFGVEFILLDDMKEIEKIRFKNHFTGALRILVFIMILVDDFDISNLIEQVKNSNFFLVSFFFKKLV